MKPMTHRETYDKVVDYLTSIKGGSASRLNLIPTVLEAGYARNFALVEDLACGRAANILSDVYDLATIATGGDDTFLDLNELCYVLGGDRAGANALKAVLGVA